MRSFPAKQRQYLIPIYPLRGTRDAMLFLVMNIAPNLTKHPPRSPHEKLGGYAILARTTDKCRADLNGNIGEYHFDCPLDNMLFSFKEITGKEFQAEIKRGATDDQVVDWLERAGARRTPEEIQAWSEKVIANKPYENPEKRDWFIGMCEPLGLDPKTTTLFQMLDADDKASEVAAAKH
jgi:hypothetical protein